jgi:hypothetical protein
VPQTILVVMCAFEFAVHCAMSGHPRGTFNPGFRAIDTAILFVLLWWGGFFSGRACP